MKRFYLLSVFIVFLGLSAQEPYHPYPIIWVHGIWSGPNAWGAAKWKVWGDKTHPDSIEVDSLKEGSPMWEIETKYFEKPSGKPYYDTLNYSKYHHIYQEVVQFIPSDGTIDKFDFSFRFPNDIGRSAKLAKKVKQVLKEYYGEDWESNPDAKVILIGHSMGAPSIRTMLQVEYPELADHTYKVITISGVNEGSPWATPELAGLHAAMVLNLPIVHFYMGDFFKFKIGGYATSLSQITRVGVALYNLIDQGLTISSIMTTAIAILSFGFPQLFPINIGIGSPSELMGFIGIEAALSFLSGAFIVGGIGGLILDGPTDLSYGSCVMDNINVYHPAPDSIKYVWITQRGGLPASEGWFWAINAGLIAGMFIPSSPIYNPALGLVCSAASISFFVFQETSDLLVYTDAQDPSEQPAFANVPTENMRYITINGVWHCEESAYPDTFVKAIEDPPEVYLDSISFGGVVKALKSDGVDTIAALPDTLWGRLNDYFMAQNKFTVRVNGFSAKTLTYPENLGYNGNNFFIDDNKLYGMGGGMNEIEINSTNILGERVTLTKKIWIAPPVAVVPVKPSIAQVFKKEVLDSLHIESYAIPTIPIENYKLYVSIPITLDSCKIDSFMPDVDTIADTIKMSYNLDSTFLQTGGKYRINAVVIDENGIKSQYLWPFYVDTAAPKISVIWPDSTVPVISPRKTDSIRVSFRIRDDLDDYFFQVDSVRIKIIKDNNIIWQSTPTCYYKYRQKVSFPIPSNIQDGEYMVVINAYDKVAREGSDTAYFRIDGTPPQIQVITKLSPNPFTSNDEMLSFQYFTNEWTKFDVSFEDIGDTSVCYRMNGFGHYDADLNDIPDTNNFYYNDIKDGIYKVTMKFTDEAGNDTTFTGLSIVDNDSLLRVDRTAPVIFAENITPYFVSDKDTLRINFKIAQIIDDERNRGTINIDASLNNDTVWTNSTSDNIKEYTFYLPAASFERGFHTIKIHAIDSLGNKRERMLAFTKNTYGTYIVKPSVNDTISGIIAIKGVASDPDLLDGLPFDKYKLIYQQIGESSWHSNGIEVPISRRNPNDSLNEGSEQITMENTLAYWDVSDLSEGSYCLRLMSYESGGIIDTFDVSVYVKSVSIVNPSIDSIGLYITGNDNILNPDEGDTLKVDYIIGGKPSNVNIDIIDPSERCVYDVMHKNVYPYYGVPSDTSTEGFYLFYNDSLWYLLWNFSGFHPFNVSIKGYDGGTGFTISDTLGADTTFTLTNSGPNLGINGLGDTFGGITFSSDFQKIGFTFEETGLPSQNVYLGEAMAHPDTGSFIIPLHPEVLWQGTYHNADVSGGNYTVKVSAEGIDGIGYAYQEKAFTVVSHLKDSIIGINPSILYPNPIDPSLSTITLSFKSNIDVKVDVDVFRDTTLITRVAENDTFRGGFIHNVSWNGTVEGNFADEGNNYYFKVYLTTLDGLERDTLTSNTFAIVDSMNVVSGGFYIPTEYRTGFYKGIPVYDPYPELMFDAYGSGTIYENAYYKFKLHAKTMKKRNVGWSAEAYVPDENTLNEYFNIPVWPQQNKPQISLGYTTYSPYSHFNVLFSAYNTKWYTIHESVWVDSNAFYYNDLPCIREFHDVYVYESSEKGVRGNASSFLGQYSYIYNPQGELVDEWGWTIGLVSITASAKYIVSKDSLVDERIGYLPSDSVFNCQGGVIIDSFYIKYSDKVNKYRFYMTVDGKTVSKEISLGSLSDSLKLHGVKVHFDYMGPDSDSIKFYIRVDVDTSNLANYWQKDVVHSGMCKFDGSVYKPDSVKISDILSIPTDLLQILPPVYDTTLLEGNGISLTLDTTHDVDRVIAEVTDTSAITSTWTTAVDPVIKDTLIKSVIPVRLKYLGNVDEFSPTGYYDNVKVSDFYQHNVKSWGIIIKPYRKGIFIISGGEITDAPWELPTFPPQEGSTAVNSFVSSSDGNTTGTSNGIVYFHNPYQNVDDSFEAKAGFEYCQKVYTFGGGNRWGLYCITSNSWVDNNLSDIWKGQTSITLNPLSIDSIGYPYIKRGKIEQTTITGSAEKPIYPSVSEWDVAGTDDTTGYKIVVHTPGGDFDSGWQMSDYTLVANPFQVEMKFTGKKLDEVNIKHKDYKKCTFFENGSESNSLLNITNWNIKNRYITKKTNNDVSIPDDSIHLFGYGSGKNDYFEPFLNLTSHPREYLPIWKGFWTNLSGKYYQFYYFDGKEVRSIDTTRKQYIPGEPLTYWETSDIGGNITLMMYLYNDSLAQVPDEIHTAKALIGDIIIPSTSVNLTAKSPYRRAKIDFGSSSPFDTAVVSLCPIYSEDAGLGGETPYIGGNIGPILLISPRGDSLGSATISYRYTADEISKYNVDTSNISLFTLTEDCNINQLTSGTTLNSDGMLTIWTSPGTFQSNGNNNFVSTLKPSQTVIYKPKLPPSFSTQETTATIKVIANITYPETLMAIIRKKVKSSADTSHNAFSFRLNNTQGNNDKKIITIYDVLEEMKKEHSTSARFFESRNIPLTYTIVTDTFSFVMIDTVRWLNIFLGLDTTKIWVGDREAFMYGLTGDTSIQVRNCPVGYTEIIRDTIGPEIFFVENPEPTISYIDDIDTIRFFSTDSGKVYYTRFGLSGEIQDIREWDVMPYETLSVIWNGRTSTGDFTDAGLYPYIVYGVDIAGNRSAEYRHNWNVDWKVPVHIVYPIAGQWLRGAPTLLSTIDGGYQWSVQWQKKWGNYWGYIGMEEHPGDGINWNTTNLPDERDVWLRVYSEDPYGFTGSDSVRIAGIDNSPPVSSINITPSDRAINMGEYTAVDLIRSIIPLTRFIITSEDTFSGVRKREYQWLSEWQTEPSGGWHFYSVLGITIPWDADEGKYTIFYRAKDWAGNIEEPKYLYVYLDSSAPQSQLVFGQPSSWYNDTLYIAPQTPIHISAEDMSGVDSSKYMIYGYIAGVPDTLVNWTLAADTFYLPYTSLVNTYFIKFYSVDGFGHQEAVKDTVVKVDCTPPVTGISIGNPRYPLTADSLPLYITSQTPITLTATDDISGVDSIKWEVGTEKWEVNDSTTTFNITGTDGEYEIKYYAVDKAGNREDTKDTTIYLDNTPPISQISVGEPNCQGLYININTPITITATDNLSGVKQTEYAIDDTLNINTYTSQFTIPDEGIHYIYYRSRDNVENTEKWKVLEVRVDKTPSITQMGIGNPSVNGYYITSSTPLMLTAKDPVSNGVASGVNTIKWEVGTKNWEVEDSITTFNITGNDGEYTIKYYSIDNVQNTEIEKDTLVYLDNTPPLTTLHIGDPNYQPTADSSQLYITSQTPITLTSTDAGSGVDTIKYKVGSENWEVYNGVFIIPTEGIHTIEYYAIDKLGNTENIKNIELKVDNTTPISNLYLSEPEYESLYVTSNTEITIKSYDPLSAGVSSGVHFVKWEVGTEKWEVEDTITTFNITGADGTYFIDYYSIDNVKNTETTKQDSVILDNTPPITGISFGNPRYQPTSDSSQLYITSQTPIDLTATDNLSGVHFVKWEVGSGNWEVEDSIATFNITGNDGEYTIKYYSIDNVQNTEAEKDTTIYLDNTPPVTEVTIGNPHYPLNPDSSQPTYITSQTPINMNVSDAGCGVQNAEYQVDNTGWVSYTDSTTFNLSSVGEGLHTLYYRSVDNLGNQEQTKTFLLAVDDTHPITTLHIGEPKYQGIVDRVLGIDEEVRSKKWEVGSKKGEKKTNNTKKNVAGLINQAPTNIRMTNNGGDTTIITSNTPLTLTGEDPISAGVASGMKEVGYRIDLSNWITITGDSTEFNITGPDTTYRVDYRGEDNVLNLEPSNTQYFILDNTPPEVEIISPPDSTMVNQDIKIRGKVSDIHIAYWWLEYGQGDNPSSWTLLSEGTTDTAGIIGDWDTRTLTDGLYILRLRAEDVVENKAEDIHTILVGEPECEVSIEGTKRVKDVAGDEYGYIWDVDRNEEIGKMFNRVAKFDPSGMLISEWWGFKLPEGILIDTTGAFYITTMKKVLGLKESGDTIFSADGFYPKGIGVDSERVITAERFRGRIVVYNKAGDTLYTIKHPFAPSGIDIYKGKTYTTDLGINLPNTMEDSMLINWLYSHTPLDSFTVEEFQDSIFLREYGSVEGIIAYPFDLSVDKNGWVWVIETCQNRVRVYNRYGEAVLIFGEKGDSTGQFEYPQGIDVRSRKIYIADTYNNRICVFGINFPTLLTIANKGAFASAVPLEIEYTVPWPNPATNISHIRVKLNKDATLRLKIYTLGGKIVWQTEQQGYQGINEINWNLTNTAGEEVINGVYGYVIEAESGDEKVKAYEKIAIVK